jgi:O-antigen/teichoic acid export membrane protein
MFHLIIKGIPWVAGLRLITRCVGIGKIVILARILTPAQFGLFSIAILLLTVLDVFSETGINVFLIQREGKLKDYIDSAWFVSVLRGVFVGAVIYLLSFPVSAFFIEPDLKEIIELIALVPIVKGFVNPSVIKFIHNLDFKSEFYFRFLVFFIDALFAVIFTIYTKDARGIVFGLLIGAISEVILSFVYIRPIPKFKFEIEKISHILRRGKWVTMHGISEYIFRNVDDFVIGKFFGATQLGFYQIAYKLAILPITEFADVTGKVTFPVLSKYIFKKRDIKRFILVNTFVTGIVCAMLSILMVLYSKDIVLLVLGENWVSVTPLISILIIYGSIRAVSNPFLTYLLSSRNQEYVAVITTFSTLIMLILIIPLSITYGVEGIAYATVLSSIGAIPIMIFYYKKLLK